MDTKPKNKSNKPNNPDDFVAWQAIEELHWLIVDLEAVANAARHALEEAPLIADPDDRRAMGRISSLTQRTAETATAVLGEAEQIMQQVEAYLATERSGRHGEGKAKRAPARTATLVLASAS